MEKEGKIGGLVGLTLSDSLNTLRSIRGLRVEKAPAQPDPFCAETQRLENVVAAADTSVDQNDEVITSLGQQLRVLLSDSDESL